jgi:hypothetical protein
MFNFMVVRDALRKSRAKDVHVRDDDSLISLLVHDVFGGEILKTKRNRGWHFYNRVDGLRVDFTRKAIDKSENEKRFEDIPATPEETLCYYDQEEYSSFLIRFVRAFEEAIGLEKYKPGYLS